MDLKDEVWKDIKGFEGRYQISNYGRVFSIINQKILKNYLKKTGYYCIVLVNSYGKRIDERVHRLVALHFCYKPENCNVVNHIDSDKTNNYYKNLEWTTISGNTKHFFNTEKGKLQQQRITELAKLKCEKTIEVYKNNEFVGIFKGKAFCAKELGINEKTVYNGLNKNFTNRKGYTFKEIKGGDDN